MDKAIMSWWKHSLLPSKGARHYAGEALCGGAVDQDSQGLDGEQEGGHTCSWQEQQSWEDWKYVEVVEVNEEHEAGDRMHESQAQRCPVTLEAEVEERKGEVQCGSADSKVGVEGDPCLDEGIIAGRVGISHHEVRRNVIEGGDQLQKK